MQDHNHQLPRSQDICFHNTHVTVLHCPTAGSSPHIHLLLSTPAPSHFNCKDQPPKEMPQEAPREAADPMPGPSQPRGKRTLSAVLVPPIPQGPTGLTRHSAGSKTMLPTPAWPQGSQGSPCGFTQLPKRATAANAVYTQVPLLGSSSALPQGHQPSQKEPGQLALARSLCP